MCIQWGHRVVVPNCLRQRLLKELHSEHTGVVGMKSTARGCMYWSGLDNDIEAMANVAPVSCGSRPVQTSLQTWSWPTTFPEGSCEFL